MTNSLAKSYWIQNSNHLNARVQLPSTWISFCNESENRTLDGPKEAVEKYYGNFFWVLLHSCCLEMEIKTSFIYRKDFKYEFSNPILSTCTFLYTLFSFYFWCRTCVGILGVLGFGRCDKVCCFFRQNSFTSAPKFHSFGSAIPIMIFLPPEGKVLPFWAGCGRGGIRTPDTVVRSHVL